MKKRKVVIGINDFLVGGAQRLIVGQLRLFNTDKYELHLITLSQFPTKEDLYDEVPDYVVVHKLEFKGFKSLYAWLKLLHLLRDIRPDVVISNLFFSNTIFRIIKVVFGYHVIIVEHNTYTFKTFIQRLVDRVLSSITHKIIAVSKTVAEFTSRQEDIALDKFAVIHNGIPFSQIEKFREQYSSTDADFIRKEIGLKATDKIIINTARLLGQKNHLLLIDAFFEFRKSHSDYKLIILGDGPTRKLLEQRLAALGLEQSVFLLGVRRNVFAYYCISEFFVLTSRIEGFGIACIEAFACGLPVISTNVAGPDEFVEDGMNGFLTENEPHDVAQKMEKIASLTIKEKAEWRNNCIATARRYDMIENVRKYENLINECIDSR